VVTIDARDKTPIYTQLERGLRAAMATGRLKPGDQLPTVRQLAVELKINANTVARVYADLERSGAIETRRGVGSFVAAAGEEARSRRDHEKQLRSFVTRVLADGATHGFTAEELINALSSHQSGGL
jgi:GntR family transcriptional regulator